MPIPDVAPLSPPPEVSAEVKRAGPDAPDLRLLTPESYPDSEEAFLVWRKVSETPYFLDDSMRNPFAFEAVITAPNTMTFLIGGPPAQGIAYAYGLGWQKNEKGSTDRSGGSGTAFGCAICLWGRGAIFHRNLISLALKATFRSAWSPRRCFALICSKNTLALRLASHLGFSREGDIRKALRYHGSWEDVVLVGLLREEAIGEPS